MSRQSDQLDQVVESLNTSGSRSSSEDNRELHDLIETVQLVHDVAERDWPEPDFGTQLAASLSARLRPKPERVTSNGVHPMPTDDPASPLPPFPDDEAPPIPPRRSWFREGMRLVAGIVVILAVGALLAATLGGQLFGNRPSNPAAQPHASQSIFDSDVDLQRAHAAGWGREVDQPQTASNLKLTLRWVGSDTSSIFLVFDIAPLSDWPNGKVQAFNIDAILSDGTTLKQTDFGCSDIDHSGEYSCFTKFTRPSSLVGRTSINLNVAIPMLFSSPGKQGTTAVSATSSASTGAPPGALVTTYGPFKYVVDVPLREVPALQPSPTPLSATGPLPSRAYVIVNGYVDVFDAGTGDLLHQIPLALATQSPFIALDATGDRLFMTDAGSDGDRLTVYRTTDWSIVRQMPVPDIIRYLEPGSGIAASPDGRYAYVYNYNDRLRGSGPVDYWLATYDVQTGKWLDTTVDLKSCGISQLLTGAPGMVYIRCYNTGDLNVIDPIKGTILRTLPLSSVGVALGENVYSVLGVVPGSSFSTVDAQAAVQILNTSTGSSRTVPEGGMAALPPSTPGQQFGLPDLPLGISPDGSQLFVPIGSDREVKQHLADSIAVIDTQTGSVRWIEVGNAFHWIAYSPDGTTAFVELGKLDASNGWLERVDLRTGKTQSILQAPMSPQMVIAP